MQKLSKPYVRVELNFGRIIPTKPNGHKNGTTITSEIMAIIRNENVETFKRPY